MSLKMLLRAGILAASLCTTSHGAPASNAAPTTEETIQVSAKGFMFSPASITVKAGSTVTWVNMDEEPHTVFSDAGKFRSSALDTKESFSFKFEKAGTYHYLCTSHPRMLGTVVVE